MSENKELLAYYQDKVD